MNNKIPSKELHARNLEPSQIVEFVRKKNYKFIKHMGSGSCGVTVLLHDETIDEKFVCKKYEPFYSDDKEELFNNFIEEIKLLHLMSHRNIVRVFNYYIYKEFFTGYILMELIDGVEIDQYVEKKPELINEIFLQAIKGFSYLEKSNVLHRDIRPQNIMITIDGVLKILDFGFGKKIVSDTDFDKSISLNWNYEPPKEFNEQIYDFKTEIYFVGKMFEKLIMDASIEHFEYKTELRKMCESNPEKRTQSFSRILKSILENQFLEIEFSDEEREAYSNFSSSLASVVSKISETENEYYDDADKVLGKIENLYKRVMLEDWIPHNSDIIRCFVKVNYYYKKKSGFDVDYLKAFLELLRSCSNEKKNIVLMNLQSRLNSIERFSEKDNDFDDEIPF